ncbi:MAG: SDR family oxidoreductase [Desulfobacterales bacterium]|nr:SDR family oxidoreductase [Desulfobacterales bacterium]
MREDLRLKEKRFGKTIAINWPLWKDGGMKISDEQISRLSKAHIRPLPSYEGIKALENIIANAEKSQVMVIYGDNIKITNNTKKESYTDDLSLSQRTENYLKDVLSDVLKFPADKIDPKISFEEYGIDSIMISRFNVKMEDVINNLPKTLLFEYQNLEDLTKYMVKNYPNQFLKLFNVRKKEYSGDSLTDDIAIIGMSGKYPNASNLEEYWENLKNGRDCITEIPKSRWDSYEFKDKIYCKWGGFLDDVDKFDPLFFNISPREAETIDPQERLFLETAYAVIEDAGYTREKLKNYQVSVFTGVTTNTYLLLGENNGVIPTSMPWSIPNRVSYFFDFKGPSIPVDTACSASLYAVHLACESIKRGESEMAIAGGVNLYLHPSKYIQLCQSKMLSKTGQCRPFADKGDGFIPGEGVGAILLKPKSRAIADNDRIYAVIKGTSINHGGKTTGYTVPNPNAHAELILDALKKSQIDPETISYVEAHGTGTELGDPVEIRGLTLAYRNYTQKKQYCSIGSVKGNIGHLEAAAGISGLMKIVLQMQHKKIVPSIHCENLNPNINFEDSPFYIQKTMTDWGIKPRRAAVSSFGAGGANAHVILEDYEPPKSYKKNQDEPLPIVLYSKSVERLKIYAKNLMHFIERNNPDISDMAYTLRYGREEMKERIQFIVSNNNDLIKKIKDYIDGNYNNIEVNPDSNFLKTNAKIISLPTYPFLRERCWISKGSNEKQQTETLYYQEVWEEAPLSYNNNIKRNILIIEKEEDIHLIENNDIDACVFLNLNPKIIYGFIKKFIFKNRLSQIIFAFNKGSEIDPVISCVSGFCKSLEFIMPKVSFKTIEILSDNNIKDIAAYEFDNKDIEIRYSRDMRFIKNFKQVRLEETEEIPLKNGGIYLITGGVGGLGLIFNNYLSEKYDAKVISTGRSKIEKDNYIQADVTNSDDMKRVINTVIKRYGKIDGVIHAAGVIGKNSIIEKSPSEFESVLKPKIEGTFVLDETTKDLALDFFVLFSSTASILGDFGHCDYAVANRFLDSFVHFREALRKQKLRSGKTLSINWPLWRKGGMHQNQEAEEFYLKTSGMSYLETEAGIYAFENILKNNYSQVIVFSGDAARIDGILKKKHNTLDPLSCRNEVIPMKVGIQNIEEDIKKIASIILKIDMEKIDTKESLPSFGFDSISLKILSDQISELYKIEITPALFFAHNNIKKLSNFLFDNFKIQKVENSLKDDDDIAIIGMSGIFPGSPNLSEYWKNLESQKDLITEVPKERWDFGDYIKDKPYLKWGGFIPDVDKFDPLFFKITPREAEMMDPQHRLFIETVWKTVEDAGYSPPALSGKSVGVFVGVQFNDYLQLLAEQKECNIYTATGVGHAMLANRVSFLMDWHGPSESVDTACSSSLIAVHRAVCSLKRGESELAICGGVSLILSPASVISAGELGVLSIDGRCKTFDKSANGYVKGEGIGALLLKPLKKAIRDNNYIYAVIKGSAVNHGGRAASLTAPNSEAQADLLISAYSSAKIDPETISYLELHGTGTELGDPVEIEGITKAFKELSKISGKTIQKNNYCGIGSVKSNIGHLEPASGIAGMIKVILSMQNKKIPATLHVNTLNPYIKLQNTPFYIVKETINWENPVSTPRRAGVSSFGFGGSNAHVILEEYVKTKQPERIPVTNHQFSKKRYWLPISRKETNQVAKLHPLLDQNSSTLKEQKFTTILTGNEFYLRDHVVSGQKILPAAAYIEMARAAGNISSEGEIKKIKNIVWLKPIIVSDSNMEINICLYPDGEKINFEVTSNSKDNEKTIHAQGELLYETIKTSNYEKINIDEIKNRSLELKDSVVCYREFKSSGLNYGPSFQTIKKLYCNKNEALSYLSLPDLIKTNSSDFILHPSIIDGAFQTASGLQGLYDPSVPYLPFSLGELYLIKEIPINCYVYVTLNHSNIIKLNIMILNEEGEVVLKMKDFSIKKNEDELLQFLYRVAKGM